MWMWLAACTTGVPPAVVQVRTTSAEPVRVAASGKASARVWAEGENAWLGELWLDPGASVPLHHDPTEEYLVVLEGTGTLWIDGRSYALAKGATVFMPAHAKVRYENGPQRFHAMQVFAGPLSARKYDAWAPQGTLNP